MPAKIDEALKALVRARKRLREDQTAGRRRSARRAFLGAMQTVTNALDAQYPTLAAREIVIKLPAPPKPKRVALLPFCREFDTATAKLFLQLTQKRVPRFSFNAGVRKGDWILPLSVYFDPAWTGTAKWTQLVTWVVKFGSPRSIEEAVELWVKFWSEPLPTSDLVAAAEHQELLDRRAKRAKRL